MLSVINCTLSEPLKNKFAEMESLSDGWHGEGSVSPSARLSSIVPQITLKLKSLGVDEEPQVYPAYDGDIGVMWEKQKIYCTLYTDFIFSIEKYGAQRLNTILVVTKLRLSQFFKLLDWD
jgi:hypothetical protein